MKRRHLNLKKLKTYSLLERESLVDTQKSALPHVPGSSFREFSSRLPDFLGAKDLRSVARAISKAHRNSRQVLLGMGAHPIKVGLSPVLIDLLEKGILSGISANGAAIVHDFEIAFCGRTSEDVARELHTGMFGMSRETGQLLNRAINQGVRKGSGIGKAVGDFIMKSSFPFREKSVFCAASRLGIPATVHVAIGTDIIHMHPQADGRLTGEGSLRDFRLFASLVSDLEGGVYINLGSAVIMPEVFLKALTTARNLGHKVGDVTTVNMDFQQHYRPRENVLRRPTTERGSWFALTGHHEIMFPLLAAMVIEEIDSERKQKSLHVKEE